MRSIVVPVLAASFLLTVSTGLFGQTPTPPASREQSGTRARADAKKMDADVTYGRIKEMTAGQKVVIDVDNAPDKSFDMTDKEVMVKVAKGLKVGDPVKVTEHEALGKTKSVMISKHTAKGVVHGDKDPASKKP